ncbi:MAG: SDR family NAD(P)-dependent oxidoreductase [Verrucomicrobiota bacterium]
MNVLITGVSSGLGHGLAQVHLERGDSVWGLSRRNAPELAKNQKFHFQNIDITQLESMKTKMGQLLGDLDTLDLVYLNAGILGQLEDLQKTRLDDLKIIMDTNCWANKGVIDSLTSLSVQMGQVIAISSSASVNGNRGWGGYALSKAALNMLIQLYAQELRETHFISLAPGLIDTAMQDYLCADVDDTIFSSVGKLKAARGTVNMPAPKEAAHRILNSLAQLAELPSGSFADIRNL